MYRHEDAKFTVRYDGTETLIGIHERFTTAREVAHFISVLESARACMEKHRNSCSVSIDTPADAPMAFCNRASGHEGPCSETPDPDVEVPNEVWNAALQGVAQSGVARPQAVYEKFARLLKEAYQRYQDTK